MGYIGMRGPKGYGFSAFLVKACVSGAEGGVGEIREKERELGGRGSAALSPPTSLSFSRFPNPSL